MIDTPMKYNYHHWRCARKGLYEKEPVNLYVRIFLWYCGSTSDPRPGSSPTLLSGVWLTGGSAQSLLNSSTTAADGLQDTDTHQDRHYPRSSFSFEGQRRMVGLRQWAVLAGLAGRRRRRRRRRRRASVFLGFSDRASGGEWGRLRGERPGVTLGAATRVRNKSSMLEQKFHQMLGTGGHRPGSGLLFVKLHQRETGERHLAADYKSKPTLQNSFSAETELLLWSKLRFSRT